MAKNRRTPRRAMHYWCVGWNEVVIRARTARVAVRKWLRSNAANHYLISSHELDNPGGSGFMPHETRDIPKWSGHAKSYARSLSVADVPVQPARRGEKGKGAPERGGFWSGFNRR